MDIYQIISIIGAIVLFVALFIFILQQKPQTKIK